MGRARYLTHIVDPNIRESWETRGEYLTGFDKSESQLHSRWKVLYIKRKYPVSCIPHWTRKKIQCSLTVLCLRDFHFNQTSSPWHVYLRVMPSDHKDATRWPKMFLTSFGHSGLQYLRRLRRMSHIGAQAWLSTTVVTITRTSSSIFYFIPPLIYLYCTVVGNIS